MYRSTTVHVTDRPHSAPSDDFRSGKFPGAGSDLPGTEPGTREGAFRNVEND
jgi:hypothetical protein